MLPAAATIIGYSIYRSGYESVKGIFIKTLDMTKCFSDTPSPRINFTSNAILLFSHSPSLLETDIVGAKFTLMVDAFSVGIFQLPYDTWFTPDHESIPSLRYTVLNDAVVMAIGRTNSSSITLTMETVARTPLYSEQIERVDSFTAAWRSILGYSSPGCVDAIRV